MKDTEVIESLNNAWRVLWREASVIGVQRRRLSKMIITANTLLNKSQEAAVCDFTILKKIKHISLISQSLSQDLRFGFQKDMMHTML